MVDLRLVLRLMDRGRDIILRIVPAIMLRLLLMVTAKTRMQSGREASLSCSLSLRDFRCWTLTVALLVGSSFLPAPFSTSASWWAAAVDTPGALGPPSSTIASLMITWIWSVAPASGTVSAQVHGGVGTSSTSKVSGWWRCKTVRS